LVVGVGPAGLMLGLLLARAGVRVTVLEKHSDFLRAFRGDTVPHSSTITFLDELGLGKEFDSLPGVRYIESRCDCCGVSRRCGPCRPMSSALASCLSTRQNGPTGAAELQRRSTLAAGQQDPH
jgi:hypothetical protein